MESMNLLYSEFTALWENVFSFQHNLLLHNLVADSTRCSFVAKNSSQQKPTELPYNSACLSLKKPLKVKVVHHDHYCPMPVDSSEMFWDSYDIQNVKKGEDSINLDVKTDLEFRETDYFLDDEGPLALKDEFVAKYLDDIEEHVSLDLETDGDLWRAKEVQAMLNALHADVEDPLNLDDEARYCVDACTNTSYASGYLSDDQEVPNGNCGVGDAIDGLREVDKHEDARVQVVSCEAEEEVAVPSYPGSHWNYYTALSYTFWRR